MHVGISRRRLLRAAAATAGLAGVGLASGCDLFGGSEPQQEEVPPQISDLLQQTVALGDAYDGAIARAPSLTNQLSGPRDAHRAHAAALAQAIGVPTPQPGGASSNGPTDPAAILAALREQETAGASAASQACLTGPDRLASLIGTIAAARSCHVEVLR